jgi:hypothetical protein
MCDSASITARIVALIGDENARLRSRLLSHGKERAMQKLRRFKQTTSLQDRLSEFSSGERAKAESMRDSAERCEHLKKIRQAEWRCAHRGLGELARATAAEVIGTGSRT